MYILNYSEWTSNEFTWYLFTSIWGIGMLHGCWLTVWVRLWRRHSHFSGGENARGLWCCAVWEQVQKPIIRSFPLPHSLCHFATRSHIKNRHMWANKNVIQGSEGTYTNWHVLRAYITIAYSKVQWHTVLNKAHIWDTRSLIFEMYKCSACIQMKIVRAGEICADKSKILQSTV